MLINDVCKRTGLTKDAVNVYLKHGLIENVPKQAGTRKYRHFTGKSLEEIRFVIYGKRMGFSLKQLRTIQQQIRSGAMLADEYTQCMTRQAQEIDRRMEELKQAKTLLANEIERADSLDFDRLSACGK